MVYRVLPGRRLRVDPGAVKRRRMASKGRVDRCKAACDADPNCQYFNYNNRTKLCSFKDSTPANNPDSAFSSDSRFTGYLKNTSCKEGRVSFLRQFSFMEQITTTAKPNGCNIPTLFLRGKKAEKLRWSSWINVTFIFLVHNLNTLF